MENRYIIYALQDPITFEIRYIGLSTKGKRRLRQHTQPNFLNKDYSYKGKWIRKLLMRGLTPYYLILQSFSNIIPEDLKSAERYWIKYFRDIGAPLTNTTDGGDGALGYRWRSDDPRRLRPHHMLGRKWTNEQRAEIAKKTREAMKNPAILAKCRSPRRENYYQEKAVKDSVSNIFKSRTEAAKYYNCSPCLIRKSIRLNRAVLNKTISFSEVF